MRPARWGSGFLRSGIDPGAAPTVCCAAPPLAVFGCAKRSLRSHARINPSTQPSDVARGSRSKAAAELTLILLSGEERGVVGFDRVHIHSCGNGHLGFRPDGGSPFPNAEKVTQKACSCVRPARWGSGFLRSGIDPGAAPTVCFAAPPLAVFGCAKRSLRSHARINPFTQPSDVARGSRSKAAAELTLILLSGEGAQRGRLGICVGTAPHPSPLPEEREPICVLFKT